MNNEILNQFKHSCDIFADVIANDAEYSDAVRNRRNIKIYVPSSLKASYEADSNWAAGVTAGYLTIDTIENSDYE